MSGKCKRLDRIHAFVSRRLIPYTDPTVAIRRVPHPSDINSNTSGEMSFLLFPFLFPPLFFFLSFSLPFFFFCFIFHFCGTVMAWINTMTGCFRLSGFSRRYFRRTRELVNSLAAGTSTVCGERKGKKKKRGRGRGREQNACAQSARKQACRQSGLVSATIAPPPLALKPTHGLLFFSPYRAPLSPFGVRAAGDAMARSELVAHAHTPRVRACTHEPPCHMCAI